MAAENNTCALVADQHTVFVEGLRDLLRTEFQSVYTVGDAASLLDAARRLQPTVIVLDISSAGGDALGLIASIRRLSPDSKLITLTMHEFPKPAEIALSVGADAVVLKHCTAVDLMDAVDAVQQNLKFVSEDIGLTLPETAPN